MGPKHAIHCSSRPATPNLERWKSCLLSCISCYISDLWRGTASLLVHRQQHVSRVRSRPRMLPPAVQVYRPLRRCNAWHRCHASHRFHSLPSQGTGNGEIREWDPRVKPMTRSTLPFTWIEPPPMLQYIKPGSVPTSNMLHDSSCHEGIQKQLFKLLSSPRPFDTLTHCRSCGGCTMTFQEHCMGPGDCNMLPNPWALEDSDAASNDAASKG